jgi:hypothetical protein
MASYTFSPAHLGPIVDHAANLDCTVETLVLEAGRYSMVTANPIDPVQFAHLQDFTDIEVI